MTSSSPWSPQQLDARNRLTTVARLLSSAIHETGNGLQVISGNAEMLEARPDDPDKTRERAHRMKTYSDQAGARLQALAVLANGQPGPPRRVDLAKLAERALDLRRYTLGRAQIASSVAGAGDVMVDEGDIVRLISNLILNAEQAVRDRPNSAINISVSRSHLSVTLTVTDNGPGIPAALRSSIFEPFHPARDPGCGLAVARWVAAKYSGTLELDERTAIGAAFVLTLPAAG